MIIDGNTIGFRQQNQKLELPYMPLYLTLGVKWLNLTGFCFVGEVFDYLVAHGRMKEKEARAKFRQVQVFSQGCFPLKGTM